MRRPQVGPGDLACGPEVSAAPVRLCPRGDGLLGHPALTPLGVRLPWGCLCEPEAAQGVITDTAMPSRTCSGAPFTFMPSF